MEEDIKILEEKVITLKRHIKNYEESNCKTNIYQQLIKECQALENLIKGYRELEKRIIQLTNLLCINDSDENYIPKSKVKEKIEEYTNSILENLDEDRRWCDIELVNNFERLKKDLLEDK